MGVKNVRKMRADRMLVVRDLDPRYAGHRLHAHSYGSHFQDRFPIGGGVVEGTGGPPLFVLLVDVGAVRYQQLGDIRASVRNGMVHCSVAAEEQPMRAERDDGIARTAPYPSMS